MYFQPLDDKGECVGIYQNGELHFGTLPDNIKRTWKYADFLEDKEIEYASLYVLNKSLSDVCPDNLIDTWTNIENKLKAFYRSFILAKINLDEVCFFDLVPHQFLIEYCDIKNKITEYIFDTYEKPNNYDFLVDLTKSLSKIKRRKLNLNNNKAFIKKINIPASFCKFKIDGTVTGRLTTEKNSFPILTLKREHRDIIEPTNDVFIELDYNAAELRTFMILAGTKPPFEDMHSWNARELLKTSDRDYAKKIFFSWLYDENKTNNNLETIYNRQYVKQMYWSNGFVKTIFGRQIESDEKHALSYIIQSTTADLVLRQLIKIDNLLKDTESFIAFTIHDSIVIDLKHKDRHIIPKLLEVFSNTELGKYMVNLKIGKDYGDLKEIKL